MTSTLQTDGAGMIDGFTAKPLALNRIDQAYALVRTVVPGLSAARWREFAAGLLAPANEGGAPSQGIITAQNDRGYIFGLFCYAACDHLRHGRVLAVDNLMALDLFDSAGAMETLLRAMEDLAHRLDCAAVHTDLPAHYPTLPDSCRAAFDRFRDLGAGGDGQAPPFRLPDAAPCRPLRPVST